MQGNPSSQGKPGRFPYSVIVILVVTVVIASVVIYTLPQLMTETKFQGHVVDENGVPIADAVISAVEESTRSAADGSYSMSIKYNGPFDIQAQVDGHWVQKIRINDIGTAHKLNFTLLNDIQTTVPTGLAFVTYNATRVQEILFGWDQDIDARMQVTIDDYDPNASTMKYTFDSSVSSGVGMASGLGVSRSATVIVSGTYGNVPGQVTNCYVKKATPENERWSEIPEYKNRSTATSVVTASNGFLQSNDPHQDLQLPNALGVAVSADILGKTFNTTLPVIWSSSGPCMHLTFQMESGAQVDFKLLIEDGWIIHMWQQ